MNPSAPPGGGGQRRPAKPTNKRIKWVSIGIRTFGVLAVMVYFLFVGTYTAKEGVRYEQQAALRGATQNDAELAARSSNVELSNAELAGLSSNAELSKKKIAYVISVTADGPYMDGAAVLAYGIRKASAKSIYGHELIAIVYPTVTKSRATLEKAGWRLIEKDLPLNVSDIKGDYLREHIEKNGCCGATELLKLYAWSFTEYHRVVHLDMDSLVLDSMDELYGLDKDLLYTCDYGMMTKGSAACPVQGGFLVVRPSLKLFAELIDTVLEGDFRDGGAWGGTRIGWFWGGMTIQGLLPYFFLSLKDPSSAQEVDRCMYNNMFDNEGCRNLSTPLVKNVHFTVCQKPWACHVHDKNVRCNVFLDKWHQLREELEQAATGAFEVSCDKHHNYHPMAYLQDQAPPPEGAAYQ